MQGQGRRGGGPHRRPARRHGDLRRLRCRDRQMRKTTGGVPAQTRLQAHHRLRGLRGASPAPRQGGQARPERLPPDPAGQEPQGIPQPHQDRLEGVDRRFLHASANRPHGDREIPRRADLLFGLSGGRGSARHHGQTTSKRPRSRSDGTRRSSATTITSNCNSTRPPSSGPTTRPIPCSCT